RFPRTRISFATTYTAFSLSQFESNAALNLRFFAAFQNNTLFCDTFASNRVAVRASLITICSPQLVSGSISSGEDAGSPARKPHHKCAVPASFIAAISSTSEGSDGGQSNNISDGRPPFTGSSHGFRMCSPIGSAQ